jgi:hypothetical protein
MGLAACCRENGNVPSGSRSRGSSVSIVSDYGLGNRGSIPDRQRIFLLVYIQTSSEAHPASCPFGTGGLFPGGKARPGHDADHTPV